MCNESKINVGISMMRKTVPIPLAKELRWGWPWSPAIIDPNTSRKSAHPINTKITIIYTIIKGIKRHLLRLMAPIRQQILLDRHVANDKNSAKYTTPAYALSTAIMFRCIKLRLNTQCMPPIAEKVMPIIEMIITCVRRSQHILWDFLYRNGSCM